MHKCPECGETMEELRDENGCHLICPTCKRASYGNTSYSHAHEEMCEMFDLRREGLREMQDKYGSHSFSEERNRKGVR